MYRNLSVLLCLVLPLLLLFGCSENKKREAENQIEKHKELNKKMDSIKENNKELSQKNEEYEEEITSIKNDLEEIEGKVSQLIEDKKVLEENLDNLQAENEVLQSEVDLNNSSTISNQNSNTIDQETSLGDEDEYLFANCTELRGTYPHGVPSGHPAYQDKMDRDKDGYACE